MHSSARKNAVKMLGFARKMQEKSNISRIILDKIDKVY